MNKILFNFSVILIGLTMISCQKDDSVPIIHEDVSLDKFSDALSKYSQQVIPIICGEEETRSNGGYVELTEEEKAVLESEYKILAKNGKELFMAIGFTEKELNDIYQNGNIDDISFAAALYCMYFQSQSESRSITGNIYADCALAVAGFDVFVCLESGGKVMIKKMMKTLAGKLLGPVGVAVTLAQYTLCVGGFG